MVNKPYTCLWFYANATQAAQYYQSVFKNSRIGSENKFVSLFFVDDTKNMCLNGGPHYTHVQNGSLFVSAENEKEAKYIWDKLIVNGQVIMPLGQYGWSNCYGWCQDQFGIFWQVFTGEYKSDIPKIIPCLLFAGQQFGMANSAIEFYLNTFQNSQLVSKSLYPASKQTLSNLVLHAEFNLNGAIFKAMDGSGLE